MSCAKVGMEFTGVDKVKKVYLPKILRLRKIRHPRYVQKAHLGIVEIMILEFTSPGQFCPQQTQQGN
jgi:hypothetical protein